MKKLIHGIGINDAGYVVKKNDIIKRMGGDRKFKQIWICPFYVVWKNMLQRCYSSKFHDKRPNYVGCSVSEEWKLFSNFKAWMEKQDWEGNQLDKDLLIIGNKLYSDNTCLFVSGVVNSFINDHGNAKGQCLIGVYWHKQRNKYKAQCSNPFTNKQEHLGLFNNEQEAHEAWLAKKLEYAKELAAIQKDVRVANALISRYSNY